MARSRITDVALADTLSPFPLKLASSKYPATWSATIRGAMTTSSFVALFPNRLQMEHENYVAYKFPSGCINRGLSPSRRRGLENFLKGEHEKHIKRVTADPVKCAVHLKNLGAKTPPDFPSFSLFFLPFPSSLTCNLTLARDRKFACAAVLTRTKSSAVMRFRLNNSVVISLMRFAT